MVHYKKQHFVPQFYLANFAIKGRRIVCYDKFGGRSFVSNTRDIAEAKYFYELDGFRHGKIEYFLSQQEILFSIAYSELINLKEIESLSVKSRYSIFLFIASQLLRTNEKRIELKMVFDQLIKKLSDNRNRDYINNLIPTDPESIKLFHINLFLSSVPEFANTLSDRVWIVRQNDTDIPLWTSDHPVALSNRVSRGPFYGNLGLVSPGLEISFPLTPKLCLYSYDPSMHRSRGNPLEIDRETVKFYNTLQIMKSTQYLFSGVDNFNQARLFLKEYPQFKDPYRQRGVRVH